MEKVMGKLKANLSILLVVTSLGMVPAEGVEVASIAIPDDVALTNNVNSSPVTNLASNLEGGYLEKAEMAIGTILKSYHFSKYDYHDYNETHDGVYINVNKWSAGTYQNSANAQSVFFTYNSNLYKNELFKFNLVAGIANGYEGWEYAQGDYLPILGVSAQWKYLKTMLAPDSLAFGIELPLN
jgi:hypothetical protein